MSPCRAQSSEPQELSLLLEARNAEDGDGGRVGHWMLATDWKIDQQVQFAWAGRWDSKVRWHVRSRGHLQVRLLLGLTCGSIPRESTLAEYV